MSYLMPAFALTPVSGLDLRVVEDNAGFDALKESWEELYLNSPSATTPLKWEWMREWWRIFGRSCGALLEKPHIITLWSNGKLVCVLPLYIQRRGAMGSRVMRFISTGEVEGETTYPEYLNLIADEALQENCLPILSNYIFKQAMSRWDELNFGITAPNSCLERLLSRPFKISPAWKKETLHTALQANLREGFDNYINSLASGAKQRYRRLLRQSSGLGVSFAVAEDAESAKNFFSELVKLHQRRWNLAGKAGAFSSPKILDFHYGLIEKLMPKGDLFLSRLSHEEKTMSVIYGFISKGKFDFYQSGTDIDCENLKSPGILAHLLSMRYLAARQIHTYDFLCGSSDYKQSLATSSIIVKELTLLRPTARMAYNLSLNGCLRIGRRIRSLRSKTVKTH